jgi:formylglycine-generating enzyme
LPGGTVTDPQGAESGTDRIIRGGYWDSSPPFCRSAVRVHYEPHIRSEFLGFRVVLAETTGQ